MRLLLGLFALGLAGYSLCWVGDSHPEIKNKIESLLHTGSFHTLEIRHTAEQIMNANRQALLKDGQHQFLDPSLKFYPYLLMEVKYILSDHKTKEGVVLWDLNDGEMVLDVRGWEKTHGFGDCLKAGTDRYEFKVINTLAKKGGSSDREALSKALHVDNDVLDQWIDSCRRKKLIVQTGNRYRLHLENPKLKTLPSTTIDEPLVTQSHRGAARASKQFSFSQIERLTRAAFGHEFAIRRTTDVYLPVHCIVVQNPDGSIHTSLWNALNGQPF